MTYSRHHSTSLEAGNQQIEQLVLLWIVTLAQQDAS